MYRHMHMHMHITQILANNSFSANKSYKHLGVI